MLNKYRRVQLGEVLQDGDRYLYDDDTFGRELEDDEPLTDEKIDRRARRTGDAGRTLENKIRVYFRLVPPPIITPLTKRFKIHAHKT